VSTSSTAAAGQAIGGNLYLGFMAQAELVSKKCATDVRTDQQRTNSFSALLVKDAWVLPVNIACRMA
jgi:hypothetical protein